MALNEELTEEQRQALALVLGDAYAYRLGEASGLDDPELDVEDQEGMLRCLKLSVELGIEFD